MCSRANISGTGHRSDMGQTVLDRREMGLSNGMGFRALHALRAKQDPPNLKILPFFDEIFKIVSALAVIRHMTLNWASERVLGLVLLE